MRSSETRASFFGSSLRKAPSPGSEQADISEERAEEALRPATIAEVMAWARERVAEIAGVRIEAVKLDLKLEY